MNNRIKAYVILGLVLTVFVTLMIVPSTMSFFSNRDEITNIVDSGSVDIEIVEKFIPPATWDGMKYEKQVMVKNIGNKQAIIRVALHPYWLEKDGVTPFAGDVSFIQMNTVNIGTQSGWIDGRDGYYYYNALVDSGQETKKLLESLETKIPEELSKRYIDKQINVDVKAEAIQADIETYTKVWVSLSQSNSEIDSYLRILMKQR